MEEKFLKNAVKNIKLSPESKEKIKAACLDAKPAEKRKFSLKPALVTACACLGVAAVGAGAAALINFGGADVVVLPQVSDTSSPLGNGDPLPESRINVVEIAYEDWSALRSDAVENAEFYPMTEVELMDYYGINIFAEFPSDLVENVKSGESRGLYKDADGNVVGEKCSYCYQTPSGERTITVSFSKDCIQDGIENMWDAPSELSYISGTPAVILHTKEQDNDYYEIQFMLENVGVCIDSYGGVYLDEMVKTADSLICRGSSIYPDHIRYLQMSIAEFFDVNRRESADIRDFVPMTEEQLKEYYVVNVIPSLPEGMKGGFISDVGIFENSDGRIYNSANKYEAYSETQDKRVELWVSKDTDAYGDDMEFLSGHAATICGHTVMLYKDIDDENISAAQFYNGDVYFDLMTSGFTESELLDAVRSLLWVGNYVTFASNGEPLTVNELLQIKEQKGENLTLGDFMRYKYFDIGSGIYILEFDVEGEYTLLMTGGHINEKPDQLTLFYKEGADIDLLESDFVTVCDFISARTPELMQPLTVYRILSLKAAKGEDLTWSDFGPYQCESTGSGLYVLQYDVEGEYTLFIGGGDKREKPDYIVLDYNIYDSAYIDLLQNDLVTVRDFISVRTPDLLLPEDYEGGDTDPAVQLQKAHDVMVRCAAEGVSTDTMVQMLFEIYFRSDRIAVYADSDSFAAGIEITGGRTVESGMMVRITEGEDRTELVVPDASDYIISVVNNFLIDENTVAALKTALTDVIPTAEISVLDIDGGIYADDADAVRQGLVVEVWCGEHHYIVKTSGLPLNAETEEG